MVGNPDMIIDLYRQLCPFYKFIPIQKRVLLDIASLDEFFDHSTSVWGRTLPASQRFKIFSVVM